VEANELGGYVFNGRPGATEPVASGCTGKRRIGRER